MAGAAKTAPASLHAAVDYHRFREKRRPADGPGSVNGAGAEKKLLW